MRNGVAKIINILITELPKLEKAKLDEEMKQKLHIWKYFRPKILLEIAL